VLKELKASTLDDVAPIETLSGVQSVQVCSKSAAMDSSTSKQFSAGMKGASPSFILSVD